MGMGWEYGHVNGGSGIEKVIPAHLYFIPRAYHKPIRLDT